MALKAKLRVVLMADEVVVAEIEDGQLWQELFAASRGGAEPNRGAAELNLGRVRTALASATAFEAPRFTSAGGDPIDLFAAEIGVPRGQLIEAAAPSVTSPFVRLEQGRWRAFKSFTPARGTRAVAPIVLALTLLSLWKELARIGPATLAEGRAVLATIGMKDPNAERALRNCEWLILEGHRVRIDPGRILKAIAVAKSYCDAG